MTKEERDYQKLYRSRKCKYQEVYDGNDVLKGEFICVLNSPKKCDYQSNEEHCVLFVKL